MMRLVKFGLGIAGAFLASGSARAADAHQADGGHPVIELRQYKLVPGTREAFISLFDSTFVESQESVGMRLIGQFRDEERTNRFTWIREFPSMADRQKALESFYSGPVWQAHRGTANPMLDDNDNVLLLRSARPNSGFGPSAARATIGVPAAA